MPPSLDGDEFRMRKEFLYACCIFVGYSVVRSALNGMLGVYRLLASEGAHPYEQNITI